MTNTPSQVFSATPIARVFDFAESPPPVPATIASLIASRDQPQPYHHAMGRYEAKEFAGLQAWSALRGFALSRLESDSGHEELLATRGAVTLRFCSRNAVAAWLSGR